MRNERIIGDAKKGDWVRMTETMEENEDPRDDVGQNEVRGEETDHAGNLREDSGQNQEPRPTQVAGNRGRRSYCKIVTVSGLVALLAASVPAALQV